jgi:hypothetical protein
MMSASSFFSARALAPRAGALLLGLTLLLP